MFFWCDEKYTPGHICTKNKQLFILEVYEGSEEGEVHEYVVEKETCEESALSPHMSVHALDGIVDYRTIRVKGSISRKMVHVLIDYSSTHNFQDLDIARKLGCKLETILTFFVSVDNGSKVHNSFMSRG